MYLIYLIILIYIYIYIITWIHNRYYQMANKPQEERSAKKTLENVNSLHQLVNEDVLEAYKELRAIGMDRTVPASVRKSTLMEIIKLHWMFAQASQTILPEPKDREEQRKRAVSGAVVPMFSRKAQEDE